MSFDGLNFSEGGEGASGSAEVSQEALEQYRERARQSAAQAKKDKKQEARKKQQEDTLYKIILQFLNTPKYKGFSIYIARSLAKNIPADFLLSLLSLIHKESLQAVNAQSIPPKAPPKQNSPFPPELAKPLHHWTTLIFSVGSANPHKVLETILDQDWNLDDNLIQLMSMVIREFFTWKKFDVPWENLQSFSQVFIKNLSAQLEQQITDQQKIAE